MAKRVFKKSRSTSADRSKVRKAVRKASTTKNTTPKKVIPIRKSNGYKKNY